MKRLSVLFLLLSLSALALAGGLTVNKITCDYRENPLLVASVQPRFGWELASNDQGAAQMAYQIVVSSSPARSSDCWNSGKVVSGQSQFITYEGNRLFPGETYYWTVQVWDGQDKPSNIQNGAFTLAPSIEELSAARWIGAITKVDSHLQ